MSTIKSSTTLTTAYSVEADTTGALVIQTGATPTTAVTVSSAQVVTLANALPVASGGTGVTTSTGSGAVVLGTSPTISSPTINGTPVMGASIITRGTAVASTSGTSIDFTALPSWIKRITVMFSAVSLSSNSTFRIQLGTGSTTYTTSGYVTFGVTFSTSGLGGATDTGGFPIGTNHTAGGVTTYGGSCVITNVTGNTWSYMAICGGSSTTNGGQIGGGSVPLAAVLTAVRVTTINGTDTFDAGSINILYE